MSLSISHDAWTGPYMSFNNLRNAIASAAGFPLKNTRRSPESTLIRPFKIVDLGDIEATLTTENRQGRWKIKPHDAIVMLLAHSDCEGNIEPDDAEAIADRLEELRKEIAEDWRPRTDQFIAGLRQAAQLREAIVFS